MGNKTIIQFGYKNVNNIPKGIPLLDCRVISNPYKSGVSAEHLKAQVKLNPEFGKLVKHGVSLLHKNDTIGVGCLYGVHRSGAVSEELSKLIPGTKILKADCYV